RSPSYCSKLVDWGLDDGECNSFRSCQQNLCSLPRGRAASEGRATGVIQKSAARLDRGQRTSSDPYFQISRLPPGPGICQSGGRAGGRAGPPSRHRAEVGRGGITTYTHKIDGLTESDFILAAKIERLAK